MKNFADIRIIAKHQVLAYVQINNDEAVLHIHLRLKNKTNVGMKMSFPDAKGPWKALKNFSDGKLDENLAGQIKEMEERFKVEPTK
jgi:hypothetical protein